MADVERFRDLEAELRGLGSAIACPPTPALAIAVRARIDDRARPRPAAARPGLVERVLRPLGPGRRPVVVAAVLLVALATVLAVSPVREGVARLLHVPGIDVQRAPHQGRSATPSPGPAGLGLGDRVTLTAAPARAGFPVRVPQELGPPDEIYLLTGTYGKAVSLVYLPRANLPAVRSTGVGLLLTEVLGSLERALLIKVGGPATTISDVQVGSDPGYWLAGTPHQVAINVGQDSSIEELRLATNTLVWSDGVRVWRLESGLDQQSAVRVARSLR